MTWNYRIIRTDDDGGTDLALHEVYYNDGKPASWTCEPTTVAGSNLSGLTLNLAWMLKALTMPPLVIRDGKLVECEAEPMPARERNADPTTEPK
jgi:hypothetical protein